jgi:crotonobetainyl-CoA:carnitine CoA-transferase CaiB-like acyl-CoA transferase
MVPTSSKSTSRSTATSAAPGAGRRGAYWIEALSPHGVPCTLVRKFKEVIDDEQTRAREMTTAVWHSKAGPIRVLGVPVRVSDTPGSVRSAAPLLGADSTAVLRDLLGAGASRCRCGEMIVRP